ncbi:MAG: hypothetical protein H3Z53_00045 [archaeon]|nr:hypothetical protein [archaeon]MCP8312755.1 hypothetical protein [archaeon]
MKVPLSEYNKEWDKRKLDLQVYSIVAYSFDSVLDLDLEGLVREFKWDRKTDKLQLSYVQKIKGSNYEPFFKYRILLHKFDREQDILLRADIALIPICSSFLVCISSNEENYPQRLLDLIFKGKPFRIIEQRWISSSRRSLFTASVTEALQPLSEEHRGSNL